MAPTFGYWSLRGLAEPIRSLLAHTGQEYEEKTYNMGPPPGYDRSEWLDVKQKIGLDLPNLPYYIDGDIKMSESGAILRHLARQHGLDGSTEQEKVRVDIAQGVLQDLFVGIVRLCYNDNFETDKTAFIAGLDTNLQKCEAVLGSGNFIAGDKVTFVDFVLLEQLERYDNLVPGCLQKFPKLTAFQKRVTVLPGVKTYRSGPYFQKIKTRFYGRSCKHGHGEDSY